MSVRWALHELELHAAGSGDLRHRSQARVSVAGEAAGEAHAVDVGTTRDFRYTSKGGRNIPERLHDQSWVAVGVVDDCVQVRRDGLRGVEILTGLMDSDWHSAPYLNCRQPATYRQDGFP